MTWESLKSACFGKLGLSQYEFWASSLFDLSLRLKGFYELEEERQKSAYERDRLFTLFLLNIQISKKDRLKSTTDLIEFPWDRVDRIDVPVEKLTKKEQFEKFGRMDRQMREKYGNG